MDFNQLREYIDYQKKIGSEIVASLELEKHKRISIPFSTIILTILAVSLTNRKSRGGIGINIVVGISLAFGFIILGQVSSVFAQFGNLDPFIAVWIPNVLFFIISIITSRYAHK
jgi:lipopolysaccharide export system permease protein